MRLRMYMSSLDVRLWPSAVCLAIAVRRVPLKNMSSLDILLLKSTLVVALPLVDKPPEVLGRGVAIFARGWRARVCCDLSIMEIERELVTGMELMKRGLQHFEAIYRQGLGLQIAGEGLTHLRLGCAHATHLSISRPIVACTLNHAHIGLLL